MVGKGRRNSELEGSQRIYAKFTPTRHPLDISYTHEWAPITRHRHGLNPPHSPTSLTESSLNRPHRSAHHGPLAGPARLGPGPTQARLGPTRPRPGTAQARHGPARSHWHLPLAQAHRAHTPLSGIAGPIRLHPRLVHAPASQILLNFADFAGFSKRWILRHIVKRRFLNIHGQVQNDRHGVEIMNRGVGKVGSEKRRCGLGSRGAQGKLWRQYLMPPPLGVAPREKPAGGGQRPAG